MDREAWWSTVHSPWGHKQLDTTEWLTLSLFTLECLWSLGVQGDLGVLGLHVLQDRLKRRKGRARTLSSPSPPASSPGLAWPQYHVDGWRGASAATIACGSSWKLLPNAGHWFPQSPKCLAAPGQGSDFPGNGRSSARHVLWWSFYHLYQALGAVVTLVSQLDIGTLVLTPEQNTWKSKPWETSNKKKLRCSE